LDERDVGQSWTLELLKRLLVIFIQCVFDDHSVFTFADFAALYGFALPLVWDFDKSRR
jgi:hypothetical protein